MVDHNARLAERARSELADVTILENEGNQGLSDARNTGLRAASQPITAFLDDDAEARPGWLASLIEPYRSPDVVGTGGAVLPRWPDTPPRWLPPEFYWVVGCSYRGLPVSVDPVRNPIGASMSLQTALTLKVGGFDSVVGRVGTRPTGCEETELAIRLTAANSASVILYVPGAVVDHHVGQERLKVKYFLADAGMREFRNPASYSWPARLPDSRANDGMSPRSFPPPCCETFAMVSLVIWVHS